MARVWWNTPVISPIRKQKLVDRHSFRLAYTNSEFLSQPSLIEDECTKKYITVIQLTIVYTSFAKLLTLAQ